jgi:Fe(3+) dicitrate transport protein
MLSKKTAFSIFTSTSFTHARYTKAVVKAGTINKDIQGNKVESAPDLITRNGASLRISRFSVAALFSYTAATYADPLNTVQPAAGTGAVGLVPAYALLDLNTGLRFSKNLELKVNVSNITNKQYFTKRPSFYPGPGIWPSDGRNFSASVIIKL